MLGRFEMCQRHPHEQSFVRRYNHHDAHLWWRRRHPVPHYTPGWAIPWPIVQCESGGHNDPPNSAGASGYYQIIPSTWYSHGGGAYAPAAYLAPKYAQDIVAGRIWSSGGSSQWVCAGLVRWQ